MTLKRIALLSRGKTPEIKYNSEFEQWRSCVLDIIDTKTFKPSHADNNKTKNYPKNVFSVMICYKEMEQINLNRILKSDGSITRLPRKVQLQENIPVSTYSLTPAIRYKSLNYKETVQLLIVEDEI